MPDLAPPRPGLSVVVPVRDGRRRCRPAWLPSLHPRLFRRSRSSSSTTARATAAPPSRSASMPRRSPRPRKRAVRGAQPRRAGGSRRRARVRRRGRAGRAGHARPAAGRPRRRAGRVRNVRARPAARQLRDRPLPYAVLRSLRDTGERVPVLYSYCLAMRADVFREAGGFDPAFSRATFEDAELGWRLARTRGLSRHVRDAPVVHAVRYGLAGLARAISARAGTSRCCSCRGAREPRRPGLDAPPELARSRLRLGDRPPRVPAPSAAPHGRSAGRARSALLGLGGGEVAVSLGRRRWLWAPLGVAAFVAINVVATAAMVAAGLAWTSARCRLTGAACARPEPCASRM